MLNPNHQRKRIIVEKPTFSQNPTTGEVTEEWGFQGKYWANMIPFSTKDVLKASAINSNIKYTCRIRYSSLSKEINSFCRVKYDGKYYSINGDPLFDNEGGNHWFTLNLGSAMLTWE